MDQHDRSAATHVAQGDLRGEESRGAHTPGEKMVNVICRCPKRRYATNRLSWGFVGTGIEMPA